MLAQVCSVQITLTVYQEMDFPLLIHSEYIFLSLSPNTGILETLFLYANISSEQLQLYGGTREVCFSPGKYM